MVGERRIVGRRSSGSVAGRGTSANPGMSSEKQSEAGAKARPKGVVDAQQVDIPVPLANCNSCVGWLAYSHEETAFIQRKVARA